MGMLSGSTAMKPSGNGTWRPPGARFCAKETPPTSSGTRSVRSRFISSRESCPCDRRVAGATLLPGVDIEHALPFRRHSVADLLVLDRALGYRQALRFRFGDLPFVRALAGERVSDGAVPLVARVLEHLVTGPRRDHEPDRP